MSNFTAALNTVISNTSGARVLCIGSIQQQAGCNSSATPAAAYVEINITNNGVWTRPFVFYHQIWGPATNLTPSGYSFKLGPGDTFQMVATNSAAVGTSCSSEQLGNIVFQLDN